MLGGQDGDGGGGGGGWGVVEEDVESVATVMTALAKAGLLPPASPLRKVRGVSPHTYFTTHFTHSLLHILSSQYSPHTFFTTHSFITILH